MKRLTLLLTCFFISMGLAIAQNTQVKGIVLDESSEPVIGASVTVKGMATLGTVTNVDGEFELTVPSSAKVLVFNYLGMITQEVAIQPNMRVILKSESQDLDEVVVLGYSSMKRSTFTGAASTLRAEKIEGVPVASLDMALKGNVAGLSANTGSGQPGADTKVVIRGIGSINAGTDPLYIIDGVPITTGNWASGDASGTNSWNGSPMGALANLNPNDIESVTVLKDASATAIYGSRAANGVIVVTTKQGSKGKTKFNFVGQVGLSSLANKSFKMLNGPQYTELMTESYRNSGYTNDEIAAALSVYPLDENGKPYNTNWLDEAFRDNALTTSYELSANGGSENTTYFFSLGQFGQEAILNWGKFERTSARLNLDHKASSWLKFGVNGAFSYSTQNTPTTTAAYYINPVAGALTLSPLETPYNPDGTYRHLPVGNNNTNFVEANDYNSNDQKTNRLVTSMYAEIAFTKDLKFKTLYGFDLMTLTEDSYDDPRTTGSSAENLGRASRYNTENRVWNTSNTLNYNTTLNNKHNVHALLGQEAQEFTSVFVGAQSEGFASYKLREVSAGADPVSTYGQTDKSRLFSYFGQLNYNYDNRYYLSGSYRYDGSSKFGLNNLTASFWSVGGSWNASEESFLKDRFGWLDQLRLRSSYGTSGNSDIGFYNSYGLYSYTSYNGANASYPSQINNPDLTWEKQATFNVGLDFRIFNGRLGGILEYYNKRTSDLLLNVPLSATTGFLTQMRNIGDMENKGFEVTLNAEPVRTKDFVWKIDLNWSANKNKVVKLSRDEEEIIPASGSRIGSRKSIKVGDNVMQYKLVRYAGVNPADGAQMWYDRDGELVFTRNYNQQAVTGIGSALPDGVGGITNTFTYKGFDLSVFFFYQYGNKIFDNVSYQYQHDGSKTTSNEIASMVNRWQKPGDMSENPKRSLAQTTQVSTRYLYDGSYIRLRNAKLGYSLPQSITKKLSIDNLRFFVQGQNLLTITDYPGMDPEVPDNGEAFYAYPAPKTWTFGVDVKF